MPQNDNTYTFKRPNSSIPDLYLNSTEFSTKYCIENVNRLQILGVKWFIS